MATEKPRTIEDIELEAAAITLAEFAAIRTLATCMREIAVALPEGSALVYDLAKAAKSIDLYVKNSSRGSEVHGILVLSGVDHALREFARRDAGKVDRLTV